MARGRVQRWDGQTGRIRDDADGASVFFGDRALRGGLTPLEVRPGLEVEFDREQSERGPRARTVRRAGATPPPAGSSEAPSRRQAMPDRPAESTVPEPPAEVPLPKPLQALLRAVGAAERHPGLQLDKYLTPCPQQEQQRDALAEVAATSGDAGLLDELWGRRGATLGAPTVIRWSRMTAAPLTLHLARASALENAGICLHPVYGFTYLPGSGLKGLARAYAETVWLPAQPDQVTAWGTIQEVFGWAPGSDIVGKDEQDRPQVKPWKPPGVVPHGPDDAAASGRIIFHDAWPKTWPKLFVDIVNNHHPTYYRGEDAPGDWDSPNPVYLLAVAAGTAFEFALGKRRADVPDELLNRAREWLDGGLTQLGAGAKTAAGYGTLAPGTASSVPASPPSATARDRAEITLELATPAFLAGAGRQKDDCDLRSATIRGLLRWWWRAMHVGYVDVPALRRLEAAVWGDTASGGAVRVEVYPLGTRAPVLYDKQAEARKNQLPRPPDKKTTQGLWYHSYGMHDGGKQRQYLPPGTKWKVILRARDGHFVRTDRGGKPLPATARRIDKGILLDQARVALWWLCMVGGVGSKGRKGFGSLRFPPELEEFRGGYFVDKGKELRNACGLPEDGFKAERAEGPAIRQMVNLGRQVEPNGNGWVQVVIPTSNVWQAIDAAGMAEQAFAKRYKHRREKGALGLPRRIGHPAHGEFHPGVGVRDRHASPAHYHLDREGAGYVLRVAAFPAARLPNLPASEAMLSELLRHFLNTFPTQG